jgi:hypothetical protein
MIAGCARLVSFGPRLPRENYARLRKRDLARQLVHSVKKPIDELEALGADRLSDLGRSTSRRETTVHPLPLFIQRLGRDEHRMGRLCRDITWRTYANLQSEQFVAGPNIFESGPTEQRKFNVAGLGHQSLVVRHLITGAKRLGQEPRHGRPAGRLGARDRLQPALLLFSGLLPSLLPALRSCCAHFIERERQERLEHRPCHERGKRLDDGAAPIDAEPTKRSRCGTAVDKEEPSRGGPGDEGDDGSKRNAAARGRGPIEAVGVGHLSRTLHDSTGRGVLVDDLRSHLPAVDTMRQVREIAATFKTGGVPDPAAYRSLSPEYREAYDRLVRLQERYVAIRRAQRLAYRVGVSPESETQYIELKNVRELWGGRSPYAQGVTPPWPTEPVRRLAWLATSDARPWMPLPEEADHAALEAMVAGGVKVVGRHSGEALAIQARAEQGVAK